MPDLPKKPYIEICVIIHIILYTKDACVQKEDDKREKDYQEYPIIVHLRNIERQKYNNKKILHFVNSFF